MMAAAGEFKRLKPLAAVKCNESFALYSAKCKHINAAAFLTGGMS
jgi:hypothetical protein